MLPRHAPPSPVVQSGQDGRTGRRGCLTSIVVVGLLALLAIIAEAGSDAGPQPLRFSQPPVGEGRVLSLPDSGNWPRDRRIGEEEPIGYGSRQICSWGGATRFQAVRGSIQLNPRRSRFVKEDSVRWRTAMKILANR